MKKLNDSIQKSETKIEKNKKSLTNLNEKINEQRNIKLKYDETSRNIQTQAGSHSVVKIFSRSLSSHSLLIFSRVKTCFRCDHENFLKEKKLKLKNKVIFHN